MARKPRSSSTPAEPGVGYKRPPAHTRFRKGESGNPSGKKKKAQSVAAEADLASILSQPVTMTLKDKKRVTVTALHAVGMKLLAKALEGNLRAMALLLKHAPQNDNKKKREEEEPELLETDEDLIARFHKRYGETNQGGGDE